MAVELAVPVTAEKQVSLAKPLHVQKLEKALNLDPLLNYIDSLKPSKQRGTDTETSTDGDTDYEIEKHTDTDGNKYYNGVVVSKAERRADKSRLYNFSKVKKGRKWLKNMLLSDTSSDETSDEDAPLSPDHIQSMLRQHRTIQKYRTRFLQDKDLHQYQYYSVGLLSNYDKYMDHQKLVLGPRRKAFKDHRKLEKKLKKVKLKKLREMDDFDDDSFTEGGRTSKEGKGSQSGKVPGQKTSKVKKLTPEQMAAKRRKLWVALCKKEIAKQQKQKANARKEMMSQLKKVAKECQKESRRAAMQSQKVAKEAAIRARRLSKEMMVYWKRFEKVEKEHRKKAEKEAQEQRKMDIELMEMKRQQRKLNFLITQTELYAHFMARKMTGQTDAERNAILSRLDEPGSARPAQAVNGGVCADVTGDTYDSEEMKAIALKNAEDALQAHELKVQAHELRKPAFDQSTKVNEGLPSLTDTAISTVPDRPQPSYFQGKLKGYQLKGMNWLANLYDQGINGILADEMGLGKTVQSIALLTYMAEAQDIWGPFLIVAPASTLHNWQQEVVRFFPQLKCVPYWGNTQDRKILRKFWNQDNLNTQDASFHLVITSYQLIIQDVKYFQRIRWHYMILDEAQAIKSSSSARWKVLLQFSCRNRLLLTGTPIQNSMAELWALLHFIMPTLFDSHDEFNEWFSRDIESHVEKQSGIDEDQLSRLHMILKPFMLRRIKKDVENELSDKIEILVCCPLTLRQKLLYQAIKNKISIDDLLQTVSASSTSQAQSTTSSLMNLVMQFRKVCNHPELFERRDIRSPFHMTLDPYPLPKLIYREGFLETGIPSRCHLLYNKLYIHTPVNIHHSLQPPCAKDSLSSCFSFSRFIDLSPSELYRIMLHGPLFRWLTIVLSQKKSCVIRHRREFHEPITEVSTRYLRRDSLDLSVDAPISPARLLQSSNLQSLVFTSPSTPAYTFLPHTLHYIPETLSHRKTRCRRPSSKQDPRSPTSVKKNPLSPPGSPTKSPLSPKQKQAPKLELHIHPHRPRLPRSLPCQLTCMPAFLTKVSPKVHTASVSSLCHDRSAAWQQMREQLCGTLDGKNTLLYGSPEIAEQVRWSRYYFHPSSPGGLAAIKPAHGFTKVNVPAKESLVTDAGKLFVLDSLLERLKTDGHRVLIYSQMTRMIDILEEYMWYKKHTYIRLDGSSKISDRRDMVADFQSRTDIFVFLLSTRAGGLGINLTAADTVIFYDSDWNPTVDQQAMDRAHRLGQTKQVTVYRLICKGSIEERILQRAREKSEIQRMVISGGNFRPDSLKPKEVVSLLLDDDDMEKKLRLKQDERNKKDDNRFIERKRKTPLIPGTGKVRSGRGPGRPPKRLKMEQEQNMTVPAGAAHMAVPQHHISVPPPETDFNISLDSLSVPASPQSVMSAESETTQNSLLLGDESSNDALVIVDDTSQFSVSSPSTPNSKRGGRPRGRPRGSGVGKRPRGRGSVQKALGAAEAAATQAAKKAAYEAYGYSFGDDGGSPMLTGTLPEGIRPRRGRGRGRGKSPGILRGARHIHRPV